MGGHHHHDHGHQPSARNLAWAMGLAAAYMVAEFIGGYVSGSLALIADAGHMLSDVAAMGLSIFALWVAKRPADSQRTFGYLRAEILAALINGVALGVIAVLVVLEAVERAQQPPQVQGQILMGVATGGLLVNLAGLWLLHSDRHHNMNLRGAWLHLISDALGSVGAMLSGAAILWWQAYWLDPVISVVIALLVAHSSWRLVSDALSVLMENAPAGTDVEALRDEICKQAGVLEVHDLHVWTIASGMASLTGHVVIDPEHDQAALLADLRCLVREKYGIEHITIQCEPPGFEERVVCR